MKQKFKMDSLSKFLICTDLIGCTYEKIKPSLLYAGGLRNQSFHWRNKFLYCSRNLSPSKALVDEDKNNTQKWLWNAMKTNSSAVKNVYLIIAVILV